MTYVIGQPFAVVNCNPDKRKSKFSYDKTTGLISHSSDKIEWNNNFCVQASEGNNSRLRVGVCDENDLSQVWDFDSLNGHVYLRADRKRCVVVGPIGSEDGAVWMKISNKCSSSVWGSFEGK